MKLVSLITALSVGLCNSVCAKDVDFNVTNPADGATLAGTLAIPVSKPKAVITLASGSGQQERDEPIFGYRPFKVLSDSLVAAGYAVLRMDDRGAGESTGALDNYTTSTYIGDIRVAMEKLDSIFPGIPKGIIGHSEGGMVAYRIAASDKPCDFIVTLAAPAWPGDSLILSQGRAMSIYLTGSYEGEETESQFLDIVKSDSPALIAYPQLWTLFSMKLGDTMKFPAVQEQMSQQIQVALSPWYRDFVRYNPAEDIRKVSIPWLALNGERDFQVLPDNLATIEELNPRVKTVLLPDHNHLFQETKTGVVTDYERDGNCPTPETIKHIVEWLPSAIEHFQTSNEYKMLQWNIWQEGTMVPGGYEAIVEEIHRLSPDFVTLSEVRNYNGVDFTARLVKDLLAVGDTFYTVKSRDSGILSRYPIERFDTISPWEQDHGSVYRFLTTTDRGDKFAVTTAHLDYLNCASYEPRGYSGNTWEECEIPVSAEDVIRLNDLSLRDEAIRLFLDRAAKDLEEGYTVLIGGDFNEPSYLDWQENTASIRDHSGFVVPWTVTRLLNEAGFTDSYRRIYPDALTHPGFTFPSANPDVEIQRLTWAPKSDERERIDFIFYKTPAGNSLNLSEARVFGPRESILKSKVATDEGSEDYILPSGVWPTDHKGLLIRFTVK